MMFVKSNRYTYTNHRLVLVLNRCDTRQNTYTLSCTCTYWENILYTLYTHTHIYIYIYICICVYLYRAHTTNRIYIYIYVYIICLLLMSSQQVICIDLPNCSIKDLNVLPGVLSFTSLSTWNWFFYSYSIENRRTHRHDNKMSQLTFLSAGSGYFTIANSLEDLKYLTRYLICLSYEILK